jgi:hypothetical protein
VLVVIVVLAGYLLALPFVAWCRRDLASFRRPVWAGYGRRDTWRRGLRTGYACLGWGAILVALAWRMSRTRSQLVVTRAQMRSARENRVAPQGV